LCPTLSGRLDLSDSTLAQLCPQNFQDVAYGGSAGAERRRRLVTPLSMDLDRAGVSPFVWDPNDNPRASPSARYGLKPPGPCVPWYPTGDPAAPTTGAIPFPALSLRGGATPANSEFGAADWRAASSLFGRVDLNRKLTDYPKPDATTFQFAAADLPQFQQA